MPKMGLMSAIRSTTFWASWLWRASGPEALIIGEDLGTVEPGTRERLAAHDILSYALLYFEKVPPGEFPPKALAAITTHDLPTLAGLWSGSDLAEQVRLGLDPSREEERALRERVERLTGLGPKSSIDEVIPAAHAALAQALNARGGHAGGCIGGGPAAEHSQHHRRPKAELDPGVARAAR